MTDHAGEVVIVAGKPGCGKCEAAKDKLARMGYGCRFVDLMAAPADWREIDLAEPMARYQLALELPWLRVRGAWLSYPEAMKTLRGKT